MSGKRLMAEVNKALKLKGDSALRSAADQSLAIEYIPTGVLPMDCLLQGGFPRNRITELWGDASTLKSYIGYRTIAAVQAAGGTAALVDTEHAYDPEWAVELGVNEDDLILEQPLTGEAAVDKLAALVVEGVDFVLWDSVAATLVKDEADKAMSEGVALGRLAAFMSQGCKRLNTLNHRTAIVFINQTRAHIGQSYGAPPPSPGGKSLGFYASYRVLMTKAGADREEVRTPVEGEIKIARWVTRQRLHAKVEKSRVGSPLREVYFTWDLKESAVDEVSWVLDQAVMHGWVKVEKMTWTVGNVKKVGRPKMLEHLRSDEKLLDGLRQRVLLAHVNSKGGTTSDE